MMLNSMAWVKSCETGCHCRVEPSTRICPSSVVYHGSTATSLWFLDLFLLFRMVQAWFFTRGICDHWRSSFYFSVWRIPVGCDRCGLMMLYSMAWMNVFKTGCHCSVEPCARNCPSSLCITVLRGNFIVVSWFVFVVYDGASMIFYCGGFESVLLRFRGSDFFGY